MPQQRFNEPPESVPAFGGGAELDMSVCFGAIKRHRLWIALPTLAVLAGSFVFVNMLTPRYSAEARLLLENRETPLTRPSSDRQQSPEAQPPLDPEAIASQVQVAYSRDLARQVVEELKLAQIAEFDPLVEARSPVTQILSILGIVRDASRLPAEERALESYYERLSVVALEKSRVIEIRFTSKDPDLAAKIANTLAMRLIDFQARSKLDRDRQAKGYVDTKIIDLRRAVMEAENKVAAYRGRYNLVLGTGNQTLGTQSMSEVNAQLSAVQVQRADAEARAKTIRELLKSNRPIEASEVLNSPIIQRLAEQRATIRAEIAQLSTVLLPGHPRMRELNAQLTDNENQSRAQAERVARTLDSDARTATERVNSLRQVVEQLQKANVTQGDQEVELRSLEREAKAQRDLLESWLHMYREAIARDSPDARVADARIVSNAVANNTPTFPKKLPIILVSTLATLFVALMIVVTREISSGRAFAGKAVGRIEPGPVAEAFVPVPSVAPAEPEAPAAAVDTGVGQAIAAPKAEQSQFRGSVSAFAGLLRSRNGVPTAKRVLISPVEAGRPGSFPLDLGRLLARQGARVILIDAIARAGGVSARAGLETVPGISDLLAGTARFGEVMHPDESSPLHLVPAGRGGASFDPAALTGQRFATVMSALDAAYDHVVVVLPSILDVEVALVMTAQFDAVVLDSASAEGQVTSAVRAAFEASGARIVLDSAIAEANSLPLARQRAA